MGSFRAMGNERILDVARKTLGYQTISEDLGSSILVKLNAHEVKEEVVPVIAGQMHVNTKVVFNGYDLWL
jgi:hypothetical protein